MTSPQAGSAVDTLLDLSLSDVTTGWFNCSDTFLLASEWRHHRQAQLQTYFPALTLSDVTRQRESKKSSAADKSLFVSERNHRWVMTHLWHRWAWSGCCRWGSRRRSWPWPDPSSLPAVHLFSSTWNKFQLKCIVSSDNVTHFEIYPL